MADWTNAADARHQRGHFRKRPAFAKLLEAAELGHVKAGVFHATLFVEMQGDLRMSLDASDRINDDGFALCQFLS